jgi:C-terminal processing protease CtpA/Prc
MSGEQITLVLYSEDPDVFGKEYQSELQSFRHSLQKAGVEVSSSDTKMDSPAAGAGWVNEFIIPIAQIGVPAVATIVGVWLHGRFGRKVRVEFYADGKPKRIEAQTPEQLISIIDETRREAQPRPAKKKTK